MLPYAAWHFTSFWSNAMRSRLSLGALTALSLLAVGSAEAQSPARPQFGALVGASLSSVTDTDFAGLDGDVGAELKSKRRVGFQLGAYLTQPLSGALSVQPEVHYIQKGVKLDFASTDPEFPIDGALTIKLAYLEVPLLLRYDVGQGTGLRPFFVAGPSLAYRIACQVGIESSEFDADQDCDADDGDSTTEDDQVKKFDAGGIVGAGVRGMFGSRTISAQVRYSRGFVTIAKDAGEASPRNTGISVLFGIGF